MHEHEEQEENPFLTGLKGFFMCALGCFSLSQIWIFVVGDGNSTLIKILLGVFLVPLALSLAIGGLFVIIGAFGAILRR